VVVFEIALYATVPVGSVPTNRTTRARGIDVIVVIQLPAGGSAFETQNLQNRLGVPAQAFLLRAALFQ
jgi:hypothetical protein|tara:strand:+ start:571 stop:774 length:204 start_codon:yes stop_codon:yes gene_type:complete